MRLLRRIRRIWNKREWQDALNAYWAATTPDQERAAYARMRRLGANGY